MPRKNRFKHREQEIRAKRLYQKQKKGKGRTHFSTISVVYSVTLTGTALQLQDLPSPGKHYDDLSSAGGHDEDLHSAGGHDEDPSYPSTLLP